MTAGLDFAVGELFENEIANHSGKEPNGTTEKKKKVTTK